MRFVTPIRARLVVCLALVIVGVCLPVRAAVVGEPAPLMKLQDSSGKIWQLTDFEKRALLVCIVSDAASPQMQTYVQALNQRAAVWADGLRAAALLILPKLDPAAVAAWVSQVLPDGNARQLVVLVDPDLAYSRALVDNVGRLAMVILNPRHTVAYSRQTQPGEDLPNLDILTGELARAANRVVGLATDTLTITEDDSAVVILETGQFRMAFYRASGYIMGGGRLTQGIPLYNESLEVTLEDGRKLYQSFAGRPNRTAGIWTWRVPDSQDCVVEVAGALIDAQGNPANVGFWKTYRITQGKVTITSRVSMAGEVGIRSILNQLVLPHDVDVESQDARPMPQGPLYGQCWVIEQTLGL